MKKKNLTKSAMSSLLVSGIILVIGILFCCSLSMGVGGISILIGISMIISGVMILVNCVIANKNLLGMDGIMGSSIVAFGLMFSAKKMAGLIFDFIPFILIVFGACVIVDACVKKFKTKRISVSGFIGELLIGAITMALGFCLKFVAAFSAYASLTLGIILIVYSVIEICSIFVNKEKGEAENPQTTNDSKKSDNINKSEDSNKIVVDEVIVSEKKERKQKTTKN